MFKALVSLTLMFATASVYGASFDPEMYYDYAVQEEKGPKPADDTALVSYALMTFFCMDGGDVMTLGTDFVVTRADMKERYPECKGDEKCFEDTLDAEYRTFLSAIGFTPVKYMKPFSYYKNLMKPELPISALNQLQSKMQPALIKATDVFVDNHGWSRYGLNLLLAHVPKSPACE